jgi:hypothetical protein
MYQIPFSEVTVDNDERATRPATIGELRRRLEHQGRPWTTPTRFNDDDPLPEPPRGGQPVEPGHVEGLRALDTQEQFEACLREIHPANPLLAARWHELGFATSAPGTAGDTPTAADEDDVPEWGVG